MPKGCDCPPSTAVSNTLTKREPQTLSFLSIESTSLAPQKNPVRKFAFSVTQHHQTRLTLMKLFQRAAEGNVESDFLPEPQVWSGAESSCQLSPPSPRCSYSCRMLLKFGFKVVVRYKRKRKTGCLSSTSASLLSPTVLQPRRMRFSITSPGLYHPATIMSQALDHRHIRRKVVTSIPWAEFHDLTHLG